MVFVFAVICLAAPFLAPASPNELVGFLLTLGGSLEVMHSFRLLGERHRRAGYFAGAMTVGMGILVLENLEGKLKWTIFVVMLEMEVE